MIPVKARRIAELRRLLALLIDDEVDSMVAFMEAEEDVPQETREKRFYGMQAICRDLHALATRRVDIMAEKPGERPVFAALTDLRRDQMGVFEELLDTVLTLWRQHETDHQLDEANTKRYRRG